MPSSTIVWAIAGEIPDPALGMAAKQRSLHNNYLTLPVVLMMVSNHYPLLYAGGRGWLMAAGIVIVGGLIRHFFNTHNSGKKDWTFPFLLPGAAIGIVLLALASGLRLGGGDLASGPLRISA